MLCVLICVSICVLPLLYKYFFLSCRQGYDGQPDLLFNLDNKHLFYYGFLLEYLHLMVEGRNPLVAYLRASQRSHNSRSKTASVKLAVLRRAWNAFAQLLSINFETAFQCQVCGQHPETVVCDGTMLGFRKDFLSSCPDSQPNATLPLLTGSKHEECILLWSTR